MILPIYRSLVGARVERINVDVFGAIQPAPECPTGCAGTHSLPAEIGQYPVAHVLRDEPAGLGDEIGAAAAIRANDLAQILGIEPRRERRCELAAW